MGDKFKRQSRGSAGSKTNTSGTIVTVAKRVLVWPWASAAFGFRVVATTRSSALMQRRVHRRRRSPSARQTQKAALRLVMAASGL